MVEYVWYVSLKEHHIFIFSVVQLIFMMFDDNDIATRKWNLIEKF